MESKSWPLIEANTVIFRRSERAVKIAFAAMDIISMMYPNTGVFCFSSSFVLLNRTSYRMINDNITEYTFGLNFISLKFAQKT